MVEEADKSLLGAFLGDVEDGFCPLTVIGIHKRDHFGKGLKGCKAVISGRSQVFALLLKAIEKGKDQLRGQVFHSEGFYLNAKMICRKGKEDLEGIPVGFASGLVKMSRNWRFRNALCGREVPEGFIAVPAPPGKRVFRTRSDLSFGNFCPRQVRFRHGAEACQG